MGTGAESVQPMQGKGMAKQKERVSPGQQGVDGESPEQRGGEIESKRVGRA